MFRFNKIVICFWILWAVPYVGADVEIKPEGKDHPGSYRPWSPELKQVNPEHLYGITAEKLAKMSLDDPLLKYAYFDVLGNALQGLGTSEPEQALVLADMRRRGEAVTPMLLKLANENQETGIESAILDRIDQVGTVNLAPYLEYSRNLLRERTQTMNASLAGCASGLLSRHGSKEDIKLLERVLEERAYVATFVSDSLKALKRRLDSPKPISRPMLKDSSPTSEAATDNAADSARRPSTAKRVEETPSKPWITWISFIFVAGIMLWIVLRNGIKRWR